ncbi:MAG: hypothetical protein Q9M36_04330 [Sulfurovum sp.]|nr:hypothetical protein [Sulfurovum sp.]
MKRIHILYLISVIMVSLLVGCGGGSSSTTSILQDTTLAGTAQCSQVLSFKDGYDDDDDDDDNEGYDDDDDDGPSHNQGKSCLSCHSFASGGTVFHSLNAGDNTLGAVGFTIEIAGSVYSKGRGDGNANLSRFAGGNFTANVIDPNGNIVNSSASLSHDASRLDCNRCHTAGGNSGAPGRITSKRLSTSSTTTSTALPTATDVCTPSTPTGTTSTVVSFNSNVMPVLNAKCKSCHGSNGNFTITGTNETYANISALKGSAVAGTQYVLDKGSNTSGHGGGNVIATSSAEYSTIKAWMDAGASNN